MNTVFLIMLSFIFSPWSPTQTEYVCSPCGYSCDDEIHKGPGTCSHCNMPLVKLSSITFKNIGVEDFCQRISINKEVIILDVRSPEEFAGKSKDVPSFGHFKNAINVSINDLENRLSELTRYKNKEVLVYCSHNHRSPRASYILSTHGFKNVKNMSGGVSTFSDIKNLPCLKETFIFHKF